MSLQAPHQLERKRIFTTYLFRLSPFRSNRYYTASQSCTSGLLTAIGVVGKYFERFSITLTCSTTPSSADGKEEDAYWTLINNSSPISSIPSSSNGLSDGEIVGITTGAVAFVTAVVGLIIWFKAHAVGQTRTSPPQLFESLRPASETYQRTCSRFPELQLIRTLRHQVDFTTSLMLRS